MSFDAMRWALRVVSGLTPMEKLTLISLADRADEFHCCYPSRQRVVAETGLDVKTVQKCISSLIEKGKITRTGEMRGKTGRVPVYQLVGVDAQIDPSPKNEQPQELNGPKNGIDPKTELFQKRNSSVFGSQKQSEVLLISPLKPPRENSPANQPDPGEPDLPEVAGLNAQAWRDYATYRGEAKLRKLRPQSVSRQQRWLVEQGPPDVQREIVERTLRNEWKGLYPLGRKGDEVGRRNFQDRHAAAGERIRRDYERVVLREMAAGVFRADAGAVPGALDGEADDG